MCTSSVTIQCRKSSYTICLRRCTSNDVGRLPTPSNEKDSCIEESRNVEEVTPSDLNVYLFMYWINAESLPTLFEEVHF